MSDIKWHALDIENVFEKLQTNSQSGLTADEVCKRQQSYGVNKITEYRKDSLLKRFLRQFHNALIYILIASSLIAIYLTQWVDASVIIGVILINAIFGFLQEGKAEKALKAIRQMLSPTACVIRDGKQIIVARDTLVPGDLVVIERGDKVGADLRLIETKNLQAEEAILTGESLPVAKTPHETKEEVPLGERYSMLYSGTLITDGRGMGVVVATGRDTEVGKISEALVKVAAIDTPLLRQINSFGRWLTVLIILVALAVFLVGVFVWGDLSSELFMGIISLTVAAVPEGLPPIITIILAIGVTRMAKRNAIVRRLPAVETMGSVTVICTDKTGTLTGNKLAVQSIVTSRHQLFLPTEEIADNHDLEKAITSVVLCNDAELSYGNPIDSALVKLGSQFKINIRLLRQQFPRDDLIPYETEHKFMATLNHDHEGNSFIYIKGAPEIILERCKWQQINGQVEAVDKDYWSKNIEKIASSGERVIAVAYKLVDSTSSTLHFNDVKDDLILVALFGLIDPPRQEAMRAVKECQEAGIKVKMITGDLASTARAIAHQVGIEDGEVLTGEMIDQLNDDQLAQKSSQVNVYSRTTPEHKLRLVKALQERKEIVAMTGDGINDAPALKQADIGVAMGQKGADLAKESSEMILTDDNFTTIVRAVSEGRTIYDNLKKAILFILPVSFAQAIAVIVAILFNLILPITAVQILWVNMITAVTLCLAFGFEPQDPNVMQRPPRNQNVTLLSWHLLWRVIWVSLIMAMVIFGSFILVYQQTLNLEFARTIAVNVLVIGEIMYLINCRNLKSSSANLQSFFGSKSVLWSILAIMILQLIFTYTPFMQEFFGTVFVGIKHWGYIMGAGIITFILVELEKVFLRE